MILSVETSDSVRSRYSLMILCGKDKPVVCADTRPAGGSPHQPSQALNGLPGDAQPSLAAALFPLLLQAQPFSQLDGKEQLTRSATPGCSTTHAPYMQGTQVPWGPPAAEGLAWVHPCPRKASREANELTLPPGQGSRPRTRCELGLPPDSLCGARITPHLQSRQKAHDIPPAKVIPRPPTAAQNQLALTGRTGQTQNTISTLDATPYACCLGLWALLSPPHHSVASPQGSHTSALDPEK